MSGKSFSDKNLNDVVIINIEEDGDDKNKFVKLPAHKENNDGKETTVYQTSAELSNAENTGESLYGGKNVTVVQQMGSDDDDSPESRNDFILKFLILDLLMLVVTAGFIVMVYAIPFVRSIFIIHWLKFAIPAMIIIMVVHYTIVMDCAREWTVSTGLLGLLLIGTCFLTAALTARYDTSVLFISLVATAAVVGVCMGLACTSFDFTKFWLILIGVGVAFSVVVIGYTAYQLITGNRISAVSMGIAFVATLLSAVSLIMEIQAIIGGKTVELDTEEYALGAAMVYTSIINMFINIAKMTDYFSD